MSHSWCRFLLLLSIHAVVRLFLISTVDCFDNGGDLVLLPINPEVEDGHWLSLNCTILPHYTGNYTNRELYFLHGNDVFRNTTLVGSRTALLRLQWTLTEDGQGGGHVRCVLPDREHHVWTAIQSVTVVRRPLRPAVTNCLLWNWKYVNCTWQPSGVEQQEHIHTHTKLNQTLQWKLGDQVNDVWWDVVCKDLGTDYCAWNVSHIVDRLLQSDSCCIRVFARLRLKHLHFEERSEQFCFRPAHNLVLDGPRNVTAVNTEARQVAVQWQVPLLDPSHLGASIVYAVTVMSQWSDIPVINQSVVNQFISFSSIPHTRYAVSVKVKTLESQIWSKPASHNYTTAPAAPIMSPASSPNAFRVSHVGRYTRSVIVYWKMLRRQEYCGQWLNYVVLFRKPPVLDWRVLNVVKSANKSCVEVNVDTDADAELTVIARNDVGDTSPNVVMHLPAVQSTDVTTSLFDELVVELTNDSTVIWSWRLKSPESDGNLTLFWCRSQPSFGYCDGDIHWLHVAASQAEYNLTTNASNTQHYYYGAALNADDVYSGGIEWATCLYNISGLAAPVQDVSVFVPSFGRQGQLLVTWTHPLCDSGNQFGHIKSFVLYFCQYSGTECVDKPSHIALEGYRTAYNLSGLEPGEKYGVWIVGQTRVGQSRTHSDIVIAATSSMMLTPAFIAGLAVGSIIFLFLAVVVVWGLCKYCRRCHAKLWSPMTISVPPPGVQSNTYTANAISAPIVEYSRISYTRQGSRLSSSSRDSGQFGIASGSPLMSPESCSESGVATFMTPDNHVEQPRFNGIWPPAMTYVNDTVVALRRPIQNNHHKPSPAATSHAECFPLQPIKPRQPQDTVNDRATSAAAAGGEEDEDETHVTDSLMNSQVNGNHDPPVYQQNSDYIPHEWLNM